MHIRDPRPEDFLQLALDMTSINDAAQLASGLVGALARVEVGTPLVLSAGLDAIRRIRDAAGDSVSLVADVKICDAGEKIARRAFEAGADVVTAVAAALDDVTWQGVLMAAAEVKLTEKCPAPVLLDTIGLYEGSSRVERLGAAAHEAGIDVDLCVHRPKKAAPGFGQLMEPYAKYARYFRRMIVAGKLNPQEVQLALEAGFEILIVGGAVADAPDPATVWKQLLGNVASFQKRGQ